MATQAITMGPLGVSLHLLTFWFTFCTFCAPGRKSNGVLRAYTQMTGMPIFVKYVALQQEPLFLQSPSLT